MVKGRSQKRYPVPGPVGGTLIRSAISTLRAHGAKLPIDSHILIAVSGGSDSMALALLLTKYGRRVVRPDRISILHINHGWRGAQSDADQAFVRSWARRAHLPFKAHRLKPPVKQSGESLEKDARNARKAIFDRETSRKKGSFVVTGHQADDLAETLLWRFLTGNLGVRAEGIRVKSGVELRPLLGVRKAQLQAFLKEEGQEWCEDSTNFEGSLLRTRMRRELLPVLETLFPRAVEQLVRFGMEAQLTRRTSKSAQIDNERGDIILRKAEVLLRQPHWRALLEKSKLPNWGGELHLPGGWKLVKERATTRRPK